MQMRDKVNTGLPENNIILCQVVFQCYNLHNNDHAIICILYQTITALFDIDLHFFYKAG